MKTLIILVLLAVLLGPMRKPLLSRARVLVPAALGGVIGFWLGMYVLSRAGVPHPVWLLLPVVLAAGMATGFAGVWRDWCDEMFGKGP